MNKYAIFLIIFLILFVAFQVGLAIYYNPNRVIKRWEEKEAARSRRLHLNKGPVNNDK